MTSRAFFYSTLAGILLAASVYNLFNKGPALVAGIGLAVSWYLFDKALNE